MAVETKLTLPLEAWTDEELVALQAAILVVQQQRRTLTEAAALTDQVSRQVTEAALLVEGEAWLERELIGYPLGWRATHVGKTWRSLVPNNMDEPGVAGWREEAPADDPIPYVRPARRRDAYRKNERVTFEGTIYTATRSGVMESPKEAPGDWSATGPGRPKPPVRRD